jgi:hypothetical protein
MSGRDLGLDATVLVAAPRQSSVLAVNSEWSDEILISAANLQAYRLVYEAETWLRRVALASLLLAEGPAWASKLHSPLRDRLLAQSRANSSRWVLGIDAEEELLWSATLGQLADVLTVQDIAHQIKEPHRHHRADSCEPSQVHRRRSECACSQQSDLGRHSFGVER